MADIGPQQRRHCDCSEDQHATHGRRTGLLEMALRAVRAYRLPELETVQTLDQHRPDREAEDQRRQYPEHAQHSQIREGGDAGDVLSGKFRGDTQELAVYTTSKTPW